MSESATATASSDLRSFDESLPMALMRAREAVMRRFRPILAEYDLTEQQWRVLRALSDTDAALTAGELADRTFLLGPSLSRMIVTLADRGLIERTIDPSDARRAVLSITTTGKQLVATIAPRSIMVYHEITTQIGASDLGQLYELLSRTAALPDPT